MNGCAFLSVHEKNGIEQVARDLLASGYTIKATAGTSAFLDSHGFANTLVKKKKEGRPNVLDLLVNGEIDLVINIPGDSRAREDSLYIRRTALDRGVAYFTTMSGAWAAAQAIKVVHNEELTIKALQDYH